MAFEIEKVDVWMGRLSDRPRALMKKLEVLTTAGANLEFVVARAAARGKAVAYLAPLKGPVQVRAAQEAGFSKAARLHTLRIVGPNQAGLGEKITRALADEKLNLRGISVSVIGNRSATYIRLANAADARKARQALKRTLR